jgi:hypothetical protein
LIRRYPTQDVRVLVPDDRSELRLLFREGKRRRRDADVNVLERIRRFWLPRPGPDHPLTEEERRGVPPTATDEVSSMAQGIIGVPFDPDADDRPWP